MVVLQGLAILLGSTVVIVTIMSAVRSFVLPRSDNVFLTRLVFINVNRLFRLRLRRAKTYEDRDAIMAYFAPLTLLALPVVWLVLILFGYMFIFWGFGIQGWVDAFSLSGSSLFTLGARFSDDVLIEIIVFSEAIIGLGLLALLISYLPTMYSEFSKREFNVARLEVRAGLPPSAIEMINRLYRIHGLENAETMRPFWADWEEWFVSLEQSHTSLVALVFFRSPKPGLSWVNAGGVVLDTAALILAAVNVPTTPQMNLCIRAGYLALRSIADFFGYEYNTHPHPTDPISISREEFDEAYDSLAANDIPMKPDREQAWKDYAGWRVNYDAVLLFLAQLTMAPYAQWISDRSLPAWRGSPRVARSHHPEQDA